MQVLSATLGFDGTYKSLLLTERRGRCCKVG